MRAVALISGGLDSTVAVWSARREHEVVEGISVDYGQRAAAREAEAATALCARMGCSHRLIELRWLGALGRSALTDVAMSLPEPDLEFLDHAAASQSTAQAVWVPNRNGVLIGAAAAVAEALGCERIVVGFNAEEAASFSDNSEAFLEATNRALAFSTRAFVQVVSPTLRMEKEQIVALGLRIGAPLELIWSCYTAGPRPCWRCESCARLRRALQAAHAWDRWQETARWV